MKFRFVIALVCLSLAYREGLTSILGDCFFEYGPLSFNVCPGLDSFFYSQDSGNMSFTSDSVQYCNSNSTCSDIATQSPTYTVSNYQGSTQSPTYTVSNSQGFPSQVVTTFPEQESSGGKTQLQITLLCTQSPYYSSLFPQISDQIGLQVNSFQLSYNSDSGLTTFTVSASSYYACPMVDGCPVAFNNGGIYNLCPLKDTTVNVSALSEGQISFTLASNPSIISCPGDDNDQGDAFGTYVASSGACTILGIESLYSQPNTSNSVRILLSPNQTQTFVYFWIFCNANQVNTLEINPEINAIFLYPWDSTTFKITGSSPYACPIDMSSLTTAQTSSSSSNNALNATTSLSGKVAFAIALSGISLIVALAITCWVVRRKSPSSPSRTMDLDPPTGIYNKNL